ncbi:MAG: hypothetical protein V7603_6833, partial [Micromonosporaceae bacterium]
MDTVTAPDAGSAIPPGATPYGWPPVVAFPPPPRPPAHPGRRRVLVALAVAWALALVGTGIWYSFHGTPTVRDQTTIAQAAPHVDDAVGKVLAVAGADPVPAVSGYQKVADCGLTPVRAGARYQRSVRLYTRVGAERDLLGRVAAGLPRGYRAKMSGRSLAADAGYYVALTGGVEQPGVVKIVASTGCRALGHQPAGDPDAQPPAGDRAAIDPVLAALRAGTVRWSTHRLPCGVRTVEAVVGGAAGSLRTALHPAGAPLVSGDDVYAFRDGGAAVAARRSADTVTVTATT